MKTLQKLKNNRYKLVFFDMDYIIETKLLDTATNHLYNFRIKDLTLFNKTSASLNNYTMDVENLNYYDMKFTIVDNVKISPPYRITNIDNAQISLGTPRCGSGIYFKTDYSISNYSLIMNNYIIKRRKPGQLRIVGEVLKYTEQPNKQFCKLNTYGNWIPIDTKEVTGTDYGFIKIGEEIL